MKCLNMKIGDVLFSLANLMAFYSVNVRPDVVPTSQSTISGDEVFESKYEKECPQILKIILDNNLTDYIINCKSTHTDIVTREDALQQACLIVKVMLDFMCGSKTNVSANLVFRDNVSSICPFDFSHLNQVGLELSNHNLVKELTTKLQCSKVCDDLHSHKNQCVVLNQVNNYMKNLLPQRINEDINPSGRGNFPVDSDHTKGKTENNSMGKTQEKDRQEVKAATKNFKEQKTDVISTTRAENLPKDNTNVSRNKNYLHEEDEIEDPNDEFEGNVVQTNDLPPPRSDLGQGEKISDSPPKGKEIYPGEGFFQAEDSHFFFYFIMVSSIIVVSYLAFHNKNKILAYALEGSSGRRNRRRPNPARYRKLETNLEEAISSCATSSAASSVVY